MTITTEQATDVGEIPAAVTEAHAAYLAAWEQPFGPILLAATTALEAAASDADVDLCQWGQDMTPGAPVKDCCDEAVCADHEDDHNLLCPEFIAQLREEAL